MKAGAPVTLAHIAAAAGVSLSTVSRALRNHPRLPPATCRKVQNWAAKLGYRPNPVVSGLMAQLRMARRSSYEESIAWLGDSRHSPESGPTLRQVFQGARAQAESLGYTLEPMDLAGMGGRRMVQILRARRIRGLIVAPFAPLEFAIDLPWKELAVVACGRSLQNLTVHRADFGGYDNGWLCVRKLRERGYRRIGWFGPRSLGEINHFCYSAAFLNDQDFAQKEDRVPRLISTDLESAGKAEFLRWFGRHEPEAIVCARPTLTAAWLEEIGKKIPKDAALAAINVAGEKEPGRWAGIDQQNGVVGSNAVQIVVTQLQQHRLGLPSAANRMHTVARGTWVDGASAPKVRRKAPH